MPVHVWAGHIVGVYLLMRILLSFVGGRYVRFSNFVYSPVKIATYLKNLMARKPQHYIGHNPAGGAMVIALLLSLTGTTVTGLKLYAVEENKGPFAVIAQQMQTQLQAASLISVANAKDVKDDDGDGDEESKRADSNHIVDKQSE
jgi:cytochrome b